MRRKIFAGKTVLKKSIWFTAPYKPYIAEWLGTDRTPSLEAPGSNPSPTIFIYSVQSSSYFLYNKSFYGTKKISGTLSKFIPDFYVFISHVYNLCTVIILLTLFPNGRVVKNTNFYLGEPGSIPA